MNADIINIKSRGGFTLLEMSIVILIIALITAGIVVGSSLIRTAEIREVVAEYDRYVKAIAEFQEKYNQLPGDFTGATGFWGTDSGGCPLGTGGSAAKRATCNGDGGGTIGSVLTPATGALDTTSVEWFRMWQHLANAGLIEGIYSGNGSTAGALGATIGVNVPASKMSGGGWMVFYYQQTLDGNMWADSYGHIMAFGRTPPSTATNNGTFYPIMTTADAFALDKKMDDGLPGTGTIRSWNTSATLPNCTTGASQAAAIYDQNYTSLACAPVFILGF